MGDEWERTLGEVIAWVQERGQWPQRASRCRVEKRLGIWLYNQQEDTRLSQAQHARLAAFLQEYPSQRSQATSDWDATLAEVTAWIRVAGRMPKQNAKEDIEKRHAKWINNQRSRVGEQGKEAVAALAKIVAPVIASPSQGAPTAARTPQRRTRPSETSPLATAQAPSDPAGVATQANAALWNVQPN